MISRKWLVLGLLLALQPVSRALASKGGEGSGGGDLCEDRIKIIRDDLKNWITSGGPKGLTLPAGIKVDQYSQKMLLQMGSTKIKCVGPGDAEYPVNINGTPKICKFSANQSQSQITCDFNKFQSTDDSNQYVLVHHEYAGLGGFEMPNEDDSNYDVSNQLSGYLEEQVVTKLAVNPISPPQMLCYRKAKESDSLGYDTSAAAKLCSDAKSTAPVDCATKARHLTTLVFDIDSSVQLCAGALSASAPIKCALSAVDAFNYDVDSIVRLCRSVTR